MNSEWPVSPVLLFPSIEYIAENCPAETYQICKKKNFKFFSFSQTFESDYGGRIPIYYDPRKPRRISFPSYDDSLLISFDTFFYKPLEGNIDPSRIWTEPLDFSVYGLSPEEEAKKTAWEDKRQRKEDRRDRRSTARMYRSELRLARAEKSMALMNKDSNGYLSRYDLNRVCDANFEIKRIKKERREWRRSY